MDDMDLEKRVIETHPFEPFLPERAKVLIMGTFPPGAHRWSMEFYYPNRTNDFWFMMGLIFYGDKYALYDTMTKEFRLEKIKKLLTDRGIALHDTCHRIVRTRGNASDKYLEVIEPTDIRSLLDRIPQCKGIATTGEKAAGIASEFSSAPIPKMGEYTLGDDGLEIWRMPSTSRAYPLKLEKKADYYRKMFHHLGIIGDHEMCNH